MSNKITAKIEKNKYAIQSLTQWDKNQELVIYGLSLPSTPEIHFSTETMRNAIVRQATMDNAGVIRVNIPNSLLQKPYKIEVCICVYTGDTFETRYRMTIPVKARKKPEDYELINDEEVYSFNALENKIANLNFKLLNTVNEVNESNVALNEVLSNRIDNLIAGDNDGTNQRWDFAVSENYTVTSCYVETNGVYAMLHMKDLMSSDVSRDPCITYIPDVVAPLYDMQSVEMATSEGNFIIELHTIGDGSTMVTCEPTSGETNLEGLDVSIPYPLKTILTPDELMDLRVGADGKTYASAGEAVRVQLNKILNHLGVTWDDLD